MHVPPRRCRLLLLLIALLLLCLPLRICHCRHGGTFKCLKQLLRNKLVHHDNSK